MSERRRLPVPHYIEDILLVHLLLANLPTQLSVVHSIYPLNRLPPYVGITLDSENSQEVLLLLCTVHHLKDPLQLLNPILGYLGV